MLFKISTKLTTAVLTILPIYIIYDQFNLKKRKKDMKQEYKANREMGSSATEIIENIITVKSFAAEDYEI